LSREEDRRIIKTRNETKNAFYLLLNEKSFSKITVGELARKANINRGTFYLHYLDKYDLLEKCKNEVFDKIKEITDHPQFQENLKEVKESRHPSFFKEAPLFIINLLEYFQDNADLLKAILGPNGDPSFEEGLRGVISETFLQNVKNSFDTVDLKVPAELLAEFISAMYIGVIRYWLINDMKQSPQEIATMLFEMASKGPVIASGIIENAE